MTSLMLRSRLRLETEKTKWNWIEGRWETLRCEVPKFVEDPPQKLTEKEFELLKSYATTLAQFIRFNNEGRKNEFELRAHPDDFVAMHRAILLTDGYARIESSPVMSQLMNYVWSLCDRFKSGEIEWETFESEVEDWFLLVSNKLTALKVLR